MKLKYGVILLALVAGAIFGSARRAAAQQGDTLTVEWYDPSAGGGAGDVIRDALVNAITNDTNRPAGRVYLLKRGGYYWNRETIQNTGYPLRIVGQPAGPGSDENPPVLQMVTRDDGSINGRMITGVDDITLKNLWITGADDIGRQTAYQPIQVDANDSRIVVDNCIIDRSNFALIAFTGKNNDIFFTNNKFRNLIGRPSTQQWEGRGISVWADQDTAIVENNTFFNLEFTVFQMEGGAISYLRFNHNTMVNVGRNFLTGSWWREAYFANNLIVNGFWHGEGPADYNAAGRDPRQYQGGMMGIGALPSKYGPEQGRRILLANTAAWRDPAFATYYGTTVRPQAFVGDVTRLEYLSGQYPNIVARDTTWLSARPNFPTYPDTLLPKMWQNITDLRASVTPATPYFFDLPMIDDTTECYQCVSWPLPENFAYTTPQLLTAGTDKFPLGDLNWFPTQKAQFETNKAKYVADMQALAGSVRVLKVVGTLEAESGTTGGDATVENYTGPLPYFHMEGGGYIRWTFDMPQAATINLVISTRSQDARRGEHVRVNGTGLLNDAGFGEYSWFDLDPVVWKAYKIAQDSLVNSTGDALNLQAGPNTIELAPSWGYQEFLGVDVYIGETLLVSLNAANVTEYDIVSLVSPGGPPPPSGFKTVQLGGNGSVTWTFDAPANGNYLLNVFYAAPEGTQSADIQVAGQTVANVQLAGVVGDSSFTSSLSGTFALQAGPQSVTLNGGHVLADFVQFIQDVTTSVAGRHELPEAYFLAQNYPNPFNPTTTINFVLGKASQAKLTVYNVLGQKVVTLFDQRMNAGPHIVSFDASHLTSGVYFYRLEAGDFVSQKRMLLIK
jgi:Secretion system C-terminal sorting domain